MKYFARILGLTLIYIFLSVAQTANANDDVVRAILFYSPSCPHCHQVMAEDLPPLLDQYGAQLDIVVLDTSHPDGQVLYQAAIERFNIAPERRGVPALIVGDIVLVGSLEIPEQFPALAEGYLAQGGVDWPDIPGFVEALSSAAPAGETPEPTATIQDRSPTASPAPEVTPIAPAQDNPGSGQSTSAEDAGAVRDITSDASGNIATRFTQDVAGNSLAVLVLVGMLLIVFAIMLNFSKPHGPHTADAGANPLRQWAIPLLILVGLFVSFYMAYVETTHTAAVCGPVGDCNTVQQSEYALLFALLPIGLVGIAGYGALGFVWALERYCNGRCAQWARILLPTMALLGTLFSIYLTFLEPFVIGATCLWCLTSAVTISLILLLSGDRGKMALAELGSNRPRRRWQGSQSRLEEKHEDCSDY